MRPMLLLVCLLAMFGTANAEGNLVRNGDFEAAHAVKGSASPDQGFGAWTVGSGGLVADEWTLNSAFPGELSVLSDSPHSGTRYIRIHANGKRGLAHIFQPCPKITSGRRYRLRAWVRGGAVTFGFYEYSAGGAIKTPAVYHSTASGDAWHEISAYYIPAVEDFKSASLYISVEAGQTVDVDDVQLEEMAPLPKLKNLPPVVLENERTRIEIAPNGSLVQFINRKTGENAAATGIQTPVFAAGDASGEIPLYYVERRGDLLDLHFMDPSVEVSLRVAVKPHYFTLAVEHVTGDHVAWVQLCDLRLNLNDSVGTLLNVAWNKDFGACVLACNDKTHSYGADASRAALCAKCYREYGLQGAKIAIVGAPQTQLLDTIGEVEIGEGLPHLMRDGVWIKQSPARFYSYLMTYGVTEQNIDDVVNFAKGGFGCVEIISWWKSTPTYEPNPTFFPNGLAGMKKCADKIHAAGLDLGLHVMQAMVGWGGIGMKDPHVFPKADPRLYQDKHVTLAAAVDEKAKTLTVNEKLTDWPQNGDLFVDGEIVRYAHRSENAFLDCQRRLHGTTVFAHAAGTKVGHLVNCFSFWGDCIYAPDVNSSLMDEVADNIALVFNATGADMSYFDAGEEVACQPPSWHNQGRLALAVASRLKKPIVLEGNALYTNLSWHVITRGSPTFDPIYYGRREYTLRFKGQNPANWKKNLLTGDVGWFAPHTHSLSTDAVTPDEVLQLCLKAVGGKAPISFQVNAANLWANKRMPEMLQIIRTCDQLKRANYFSDAVCSALATPMADYTLDRTGDGIWRVRPLQFGSPAAVNAAADEGGSFAYANPYPAQRPWLRIRARTRLVPYGAPQNIVLADCKSGVPFKLDGTASTEVTQTVAPSTEKTPDGAAAFLYRAENKAAKPSSWCRLNLPFDPPKDLSTHRRIGLWVRSDGKGGILNVQLANTYGYRDHYVPLDFTGWRYVELTIPETDRFYQYTWPYNFIDTMAWVFRYNQVTGINLYLNAIPAGATTECLIGRIEALAETQVPLESPAITIGGKKIVFPETLKPDEYLEMDWDGACRHFDPDGGLISIVKPVGEVSLAHGDNTIGFTCNLSAATSPRAEITLSVRGEPLANSPGKAAQQALMKMAASHEGDLQFVPAGKRLRLMDGPYELVGGEPARAVADFDGKTNVWTVTNDHKVPWRAVVVISRDGKAAVNYDDPHAAVIESFDDLAPYAMSATNQYEQYVLGTGKLLTKYGPVREGVSQTFVAATGAHVGKSCAVYTAKNEGRPDGWCAVGKRFIKPLDLKGFQSLAMWVYGDGKGEQFKLQLRDASGRYADWSVPIDFTGWRLQVFPLAAVNCDLTKTVYVLFYYNALPTKATCALRLDDLKAIPGAEQAGGKSAAPDLLRAPVLTVNGKRITIPADIAPNQLVLLDGRGGGSLWQPTVHSNKPLHINDAAIVLRPGANRFELHCDQTHGAAADITVRVVPLQTAS